MAQILSETAKDLVALAKDFCEKEIKPYVAQWDVDGTFPLETVKKAMDLGFHLMEVPEENGGLGIDYEDACAVYEVFGYYDLGFATTLMASTLSLKPVLLFGTPEQIQLYSNIIEEGNMVAFGLTEPNSGSDAGSCKTTAVLEGDEYVLNGTKCFITNATYAEGWVIFANTDLSKGLKGLSAFIVKKSDGGITVDKHEDKMGIRTSDTAMFALTDVRIPKDRLLGKEGEGFKIAMVTLDLARPFVAAAAVGLATRAIDEAGKYSKQRICFGKPIAAMQNIQFKLADMEIAIEASRALYKHALQLYKAHIPFTKEASIAKCFAGDTAFMCAEHAIQIMGGYGYSREYPVEKLLRDAKILQIYEGTNEVQRSVVAGQVLARYKV
ncbi:MAG: acyl-CoA dehydrogenase family protein [Lachnospiraceae bacterium]|jgi:butyryl-CoA dehydrogenase|nr:acyl-CoA dehydrogenase family protein [Lachnospiraceae bacterium]